LRLAQAREGNMHKHLLVLAGMVLIAAPSMAAVSSADKEFLSGAAQGGLAEVELGQLALQKGTSPQVKQFAQRMVTDHTQANSELMQLGKFQNLNL